jgi:TolB-like protein
VTDALSRLRAALADRYLVERELGHGGMAIVFLARDIRHGRPVAIKVLRPDLAAALGGDRFLGEIQTAARLTHPHIVPLYDSGEADTLLYYVMPYLEGESLRDRLNRENQLALEDALQVAREVADALSYAHSMGVVHRDIKPENILFESGHAVVSDFGIARAISAAGGERLTETGVALGTPSYMSPEQAAGTRDLDGRSDIYSLACVLYEMLAGEPPFTGRTADSVVHQHLTAEAPLVSVIRPGAPPALARTLRRALAKTPADRFRTAVEFAEALAASGGAPAPGRRLGLPNRGRVVALVGGVVVVGIAAFLVLRPRPLVLPAASVIAVTPFEPTVPDTALTRLGRDLVVTLSASLDGVGEIRTVDPLTILAQADGPRRPYTRDAAAALARRLGAASVVHGSLLRVGGVVRLELGLFSTDPVAEVAHASVVASPHDFNALTDSVTWALLRGVWRAREPPTPSLAGVTTNSVPALRAFLDGEGAMVDGRWRDAAGAFGRAIEADSTFWLAYRRRAYARQWVFDEPESLVVAAYRTHRAALPERERLLVEAELAESSSARGVLLNDAATRFPDYWPAAMEYADWLVHFGPLLGHSSAEALEALERSVALNPRLVPAWTHVFWMSAYQGDTAASGRALAALALRPASRDLWEDSRVLRLLDQLLRTGEFRVPALVDTVAAAIAADAPLWADQNNQFLWFGFPRAQGDMSTRVIRLRVPPKITAIHRRFVARSWAARGGWDSALVAMDRYADAAPDELAGLDVYALAVVGVWLGVLDSSAAIRRRGPAAQAADRGSVESRAELAWLDGLLAFARQDSRGLAAAREILKRAGRPGRDVLGRSLDAFADELAGARRRAAHALAALEWERAERTGFVDSVDDHHPYLTAVNRLAASRWLGAEGDTAEAARLLTWHEAMRLPRSGEVGAMFSALAYLEAGRLEHGRGHLDLARYHYAQFLRRYDQPVPAHRQLVEEAKAALVTR